MNMDSMIQQAFPLRVATTECTLPFQDDAPVSYAVASDGLWQDLSSDWLALRHRVAVSDIYLPYGPLKPMVEWKCSFPPIAIWQAFAEQARQAMPNECAALFVWAPSTDSWRLAMRDALSASPTRVDYRNPVLEPGEIAVVDIHSHGRLPAGFSSVDDLDDAGSVKVSAVFGDLDTTVSVAMRLCVAGLHYKLKLGSDGSFQLGQIIEGAPR